MNYNEYCNTIFNKNSNKMLDEAIIELHSEIDAIDDEIKRLTYERKSLTKKLGHLNDIHRIKEYGEY